MSETRQQIIERRKQTSESSCTSSSSIDLSLDLSSSDYSMPPSPDGGWGWMVVFSAFMTMLISDGFAFSFGVIFSELLNVFDESKSYTSLIPSLFYGTPLLFGPISGALATMYGCRKIQIVGGIIAFIGIFSSAFANSVWMLCFTLGIVAGIGLSMGYVTSVVMVAFYFEKKRALATGLSVCGSGIGTFLFAPLIEYLINVYTWRGAFIIMSGITLNLVICGSLLRPLKFSPQEKWRKKLEIFEKLSKTISRSISKSSISDAIRSRHASNTDELESDSDSQEYDHVISHSQVQLPTYLHDGEGGSCRNDFLVKLEKNGNGWKHNITKSTNGKEYGTPSRDIGTKDHEGERSPQIIATNSQSQSIADMKKIGDVRQQKRRKHVPQYPLYRKDLFYRGNLMRLPRYQVKSTSCPELHMGSIYDDDSSDDDDDDESCCEILKCSRKTKRKLKRLFDVTVLRYPVFLLFLLSNFVLYFWYDVPYVFMVDRAKEIGIADPSFFISILGIVNTIGQILYGFAGDRDIDLYMFYGISIGLAGVSVMLVPLFEDYTMLCILSGCYGCFISANYSLATVMLVDIVGMEKLTTAYGITMMIQGIANMIGPPIAGKLYDLSGNYDNTFYAGGIFIAVSGAMLVLVPVYRGLRRMLKKCTKAPEESLSKTSKHHVIWDRSKDDNGEGSIDMFMTKNQETSL